MAHGYYQGWESDADPLHVDCSISPECQQMRTFLDLDSPTDSLCSLPADGCAYVDCYGASFLLLSPAPSVVSTMHTANALSTAEIGDTETIASSVDPGDVKVSLRGQLSPSLSFASFPGSSSTITTCTSSSSSISSQNRHSILPGTRQHFLHRQRDSIDDDVNYVDEYHTGSPRHRYTNSMRLLDRYLFEQPPTSAPKPQSRSTNRSDSPVRSASKSWRSSSDERSASSDGLASSVPLSKDEFEALPVTIQRKYFSTLERLRIIRSPEYNEVEAPAPERLHTPPAALFFDDEENQPTLRLAFGQDELENAPHRRAHIKHNPSRIYASPEKTLRKRRHISCDKPAALRLRKSVILESTEESILQLGNRQLDRSSSGSTISRSKIGKMVSFPTDTTISGSDMTSTTDSMLESFRWLEDGDDLDLRLLLDDNQFISRSEDVPAQSKRNPSFKRHLSISKLTLGGRTSTTMSRPSTKETSAATLAFGSPNGSIPGSPVQGHVRRRSRALSLITPNKQSIPDATTCVDPAAAHYQDPDARMKLRVYLASAHKFDEAVEFGFPAIEEVQGKGSTTHKRAFSQQEQSTSRLGQLRPFEDDKSSMYSDQASTAEPESPKTPETMEKPLPVEAVRGSQDEDVSAVKVDYAPAPTASREMTLRMTLTRPDLRANEEQIYGWQKTSGGRRSQTKDEPQSPVSLAREGHSKESIERQFAAMDQEDLLSNEQGVVKRFWNRVRRS